MASADTATGLAVPTGGDPFDPQGDIVELAVSLRTGTIVPAANETARNAISDRLIANGTPPTATSPLFVWQSDTQTLWLNTGTAWRPASPWSTPATARRTAAATVNIETWQNLSPVIQYRFQAGGWYEILGNGTYSIDGAAAPVYSRILASGLSVSSEMANSAAVKTSYRVGDHLLFQATVTATVSVSHQLLVRAPATGIILAPGSTVSIKAVA